jgi:hypothetical protein
MPKQGDVFRRNAATTAGRQPRIELSRPARRHLTSTTPRHRTQNLPPKTLTFASAEPAKIRGPGQLTSKYSPKTLPQSLTFDWNPPPLARPQHGYVRLPKSLTYLSRHINQ